MKDATDDGGKIAAWREQHPRANWAIATGACSGVVVVDLDRKPGKNGLERLREIVAARGGLPKTRTVRTGSGGLHLYFQHPGEEVANSASKIAPGIDVRGDGGYVMAPESNHVSGGTYSLIADLAPAPAPAWLLELLKASPAPARPAAPSKGPTVSFPPASPEVLEAARQALAEHGPAIEGNGGDEHTFIAGALLAHDFALTEEEAWPLLVEWNETCQPPWSLDDLAAKLRGGAKYATRQFGCRRTIDALSVIKKWIAEWYESGTGDAGIEPLAQRARDLVRELNVDPAARALIERELKAATALSATALALPKTRAKTPRVEIVGSWAGLDLTSSGQPQANLNNVVSILERERAQIFFDEFFQRVHHGAPPREWTDADDYALTLDLQRRVGLQKLPVQIVRQGVDTYAHRNPRNEVREKLEGLTWDGNERISTFFHRALGADDNEYTRAASTNFLRSIAARVLMPGCKVDTLPVLEGPQGLSKSTALRTLAGPRLFAEASESPHSKDFFMALQGKLIVEIAEMDALSRAEVAAAKRVLSCAVDRFRAPYERAVRDWPRQGVFAGTTNRGDWGRDDTGARRFWPIRCTTIDIELIQRERSQLFAEAVADVKSGAPWWVMPTDATASEQESRRQVHPWEELLEAYFASNPDLTQVVISDLLAFPLNFDAARMTKADQMQVASILRRLGFVRVDGWRGGTKQKFWRREGGEVAAA